MSKRPTLRQRTNTRLQAAAIDAEVARRVVAEVTEAVPRLVQKAQDKMILALMRATCAKIAAAPPRPPSGVNYTLDMFAVLALHRYFEKHPPQEG